MKNKILAVPLGLFLLFSVVISTAGEEEVSSSTSVDWLNNLEHGDILGKSIVIGEGERATSVVSVTQGIYEFLSWIGSNIQEFLGWAGGNIWDFLAWAGSNTYEASASLGKGGIILLLVLLLIIISYGATRI